MFRQIKTLVYFLSAGYESQVQKLSASIQKTTLQKIILCAQEYFPVYGRRHWRHAKDLIKDFRDDFPFSVVEEDLPGDLHGVFVPLEQGNKKGVIILDKKNSRGMHLSTIAHENGHLFAQLVRERSGEEFPRLVYARTDSIEESLQDPEELQADFIASMGAYPLPFFQKSFCNGQGRVLGIYKKAPLILWGRAMLYVFQNYPELCRNFLWTSNKMFHLCLTVHYIRLRVMVYEKYGM